MKRLLAFAALTAATGAMAQNSSVTLFGVADVAVGHVSTAGKSVSGLASGGSATSRLGFRAEEDLGAGLKASFWLEGGLDMDDGNAEGFKFDRRSTLSLSSGFGELRLGRDKTPTFQNMEHFHPFADAGMGAVNGHNLISDDATGTPAGSNPKRASNSVSYLLPKMDGVYGHAMHSFGEQSEDNRLSSSTSVRLGYAADALDMGAAYGIVRGGTGTAATDYKNFNIGASYKFGSFTPMLLLASERGNDRRVDLYSVGMKMALGKGELRAAYSMFEDKKRGDSDAQRLALGYGYELSKRTEIYANVAHLRNDAQATRHLGSSLSPTPNAGKKLTGYEIGLRHNF